MIVAPSSRFKYPCIMLAVINAAVYFPAVFGAEYAFYIIAKDNGVTAFHRGSFGFTIFFVLMCYVILLYAYSVMYFKKNQTEQSLLLIALVSLAVADAFAEYTNIMGGHSTDIIVAGTFAYYLYLTSIHYQQMRAEAAESKLKITQQEITILRDQIQPHFINNSLNIIRSLIRKDSRAAIRSIDSFSEYLQAHFRTLRHDSMIPFTEELDNVRAYLSLAMADVSRKTQIIYQLEETDFSIPPLCLEPLVENAVLHGAGEQDGIITIASHRTEQGIAVEVIDNGTGGSNPTESRKKRVGIGVENTRKRLKLLCSGSLEIRKLPEGGTCVRMLIPQEQKEKEA
jgi:sensor histidine kinase YesM